MNTNAVTAIVGVLAVIALGLIAHASGLFERGEPDISGAVEWLSAEDGSVPEPERFEIIASKPMPAEMCVSALEEFTSEYPEIKGIWQDSPGRRSISFPGAGDEGATIEVVCSEKRQLLTILQRW